MLFAPLCTPFKFAANLFLFFSQCLQKMPSDLDDYSKVSELKEH